MGGGGEDRVEVVRWVVVEVGFGQSHIVYILKTDVAHAVSNSNGGMVCSQFIMAPCGGARS